MRLMVMVAALAVLATPVMAADWRLTSYSEQGASLVDASSVRVLRPGVRTAWVATVWFTPLRGVDYSLSRNEYDCGNETSTNIAYYQYRANGTSIDGETVRQAPESAAPGSIAEGRMLLVCGLQDFRQQSWSSIVDFLPEYRSPNFNPRP